MDKEYLKRSEEGQVLVLLVFGIIALLAVAGLAIDGGTVFLQRRRMQNSADASALAGTRLLAAAICEKDGVDDASIWAEVQAYAAKNGVNDPADNVMAYYVNHEKQALGLVGDGTIPHGATGISSTVKITSSTYFMMLVGIDEAGASAAALAVTGPPLMLSGGLRPFGVPHDVVKDLDPDDDANNDFSITFKNDGGSVTWGDGNLAQHRGWMNMGYLWNNSENPTFPRAISQAGNAADLKEWMANGWDGTIYIDCLWRDGCANGDFIHAKPGTNSSAVCQAPVDPDQITIPVYDIIADCEPEIPDPKPDCPTQGSGFCYHIIGVAAVRITGCSQGGGTIAMELDRLVTGEGMPNLSEYTGFGGTQACAGGYQIVNLSK
ncbi:MAG TPA: hypothetical protein ENN19_17585 [Chloroflexi bacterium]|nr:hypothetical protein [Chloroflexota bacterium]